MSMMGSAFKEMGETILKNLKRKKKKKAREVAEQTNDSKKVVDSTFTF
jgi:hypothetical protein